MMKVAFVVNGKPDLRPVHRQQSLKSLVQVTQLTAILATCAPAAVTQEPCTGNSANSNTCDLCTSSSHSRALYR